MQTPDFRDILEPGFKRYYPAFGGNANRKIDACIEEDGTIKPITATWWYDCTENGNTIEPGERTTFNARNLDSSYWKGAVKHRRAIVFATGLGESKRVGKTKHQYYFDSEEVFALGALYRTFENGCYSLAIITRDSHPKMEPYHDKAFPCFLPNDEEFLKLWLSQDVEQHPRLDYVLNNPTLYPTLHVTRVKTFKDKVPMPSFTPTTLQSDVA
ncbi:SOS response-associated peptidase family protein [Neptunicella sp. SCSIO 80796]|uniref:SOS response-associated peptidase family protein n=1 Tax=Neptunicella plasticusilytica TaxID=3117012 RepID=UPI003A4D48B9